MKEILFNQFRQILDAYKPTNICEIGTHEGKSSGQFIGHLLETVGVEKLKYTGYDAFELADRQSDITEVNGKGPGTLAGASSRIGIYKSKYPTKFDYELIKGWTQDTLKDSVFDFVYIDGGHSYESVKFDHSKLEKSTVIVFDDYQIDPVKKYFDEYVTANNIPEVEFNPVNIKKENKTVWSFLPHPLKKNKITGELQRVQHVQPCIFRSVV
jgi:hypothetical protein